MLPMMDGALHSGLGLIYINGGHGERREMQAKAPRENPSANPRTRSGY